MGVLTVGSVTEEIQQQEAHNRMVEAKVRELVGTVQTLTSSEVSLGPTSHLVQKHIERFAIDGDPSQSHRSPQSLRQSSQNSRKFRTV